MILCGIDTCDGKGVKSPFCDIHGKELVCGDRVMVSFKTPREDGITYVNFAFATVVFEREKGWALYAGRKLGFLAQPLTQEYITEHEVERRRFKDEEETYLSLKSYCKAATEVLKKQKRRNKKWKKN